MATLRTKSYLLTRFEAGDRPTDVDFADLFESICILGETGLGSAGTTTGFDGNVTIGGTLTLTGQLQMPAELMVGSITETLSMPIQAYTSQDETVIFASGSISDNMFQGVSGDSTSSIRLQDDLTHVRFGTHTNKGFLEVHGEEIIHYTTGSSSTSNVVHISASVGIGTTSPSEELHVVGSGLFDGLDGATNPSPSSETTMINGYGIIGNRGSFYITNANAGAMYFGIGGVHNAATKMTILNSGNVGIGTISPGQKLHIYAASNPSISVEGAPGTGAFIRFKDDTQSWRIGKQAGDTFALYDSTGATTPIIVDKATPTYTLRLLSSGNVGIGTGTPSHKLHLFDSTNDVNLLVESTKTNGRAQIRFKNDTNQWQSGIGQSNQFLIFDGTNSTTPFYIEPGTGDHTLYLDSNEKVGIGKSNPEEKLTVDGGHISMSGNYGLIRRHSSAGNDQNYGIIPYSSGNSYSFVNISNSPAPNGAGLRLETDHMIHFVESDADALGVQFDMNNKQFRFDGPITASHFIGDGSGLTGVNAQQVVGFISNDVNNYVTTAAGNGTLNGEANLQFDGSQLYVNGEIGVGQSNPTAQIEVGTTRPIKIGAGANPSTATEGSISSQGTSAGGWANYFKFLGSSNTDHGGFYGLGNQDTFTRWGIASTYNSDYGLHIVSVGNGATDVKVGIGTVTPTSMLHIHADSTATASLHIESDGSNKDSTVHLRQAGALYGAGTAGTGVDLVYDGGADYLMLKGYTNSNGLEGEGFKYKPQTDNNTLVLREHYKVGIGLVNPANILHIYSGSGNPSVMVESGGTGVGAYIRFKDSGQTWRLGKNTNDYFTLYDVNATTSPLVIEDGAPDNSIRVDNNGKVGVGTSNPSQKLDVRGKGVFSSSNYVDLRVDQSDSGQAILSVTSGTGKVNLGSQKNDASFSSDIEFRHNDETGTLISRSIYATEDGKVGIGTATVNAKFYVYGGSYDYSPSANGSNMIEWVGGASSLYTGYLGIDDNGVHLGHNSSTRDIRFQTDETTRMTIQSGSVGKVGIGTINPRGRLHVHDTVDMSGGTQEVDLLTLSITGNTNEGTGSILFADNNDYVDQHYKIQFLEGSNRLKFKSDSTDNVLVLEPGGYVGIGIDNPTYNLHVVGNTNITGDLTVGGVVTSGGTVTFPTVDHTDPSDGNDLNNTHIVETAFNFPVVGDGITLDYGAKSDTTDHTFVQFRIRDNNTNDSFRVYIDDYQGAGFDRIPFEAMGNKVLLCQDGGNTGIGTTTPLERLHVIGKVKLENQLIVSSSGQTDEGAQINWEKASGYTGHYYVDAYQDQFRFVHNNGSSDAIRMVIGADGTVKAGHNYNTQLGYNYYSSSYASVVHKSLDDNVSGNYALLQSSTGVTYLNAASTKDIHFRINNTTYGKMDESGLWGIGPGFQSSDPSYRLHISGSDPILTLESNGTSTDSRIYLKQKPGSPTGTWLTYDGGVDRFYIHMEDSAGTKSVRFALEHDGKVGLGTADPDVRLHLRDTGEILRVEDSSASGNPYMSFYQTTTRRAYIQSVDSNNKLRLNAEYGAMQFYTNGTHAVEITSGQDVGIGTTSTGFNDVSDGDGTWSVNTANLKATGTIYTDGQMVADSYRSWRTKSAGSGVLTNYWWKICHFSLSSWGYASHRMLIKSSGNSDANNVACVMDFALKNQSGNAPGRWKNVANNYGDNWIQAGALDVVQWTNGAWNGGARNGSSDDVNQSSYPRIYEFWLLGTSTSHDSIDVTLLGNCYSSPHWGNEALKSGMNDEYESQVWAPSLSNGNGSSRWTSYKEFDGMIMDPSNDTIMVGTVSERYQQTNRPRLIVEGRTDQGSSVGFKDNDSDNLWMMGYSNHNNYSDSLEFRHTGGDGTGDTITTWSFIAQSNQGILQFTGQHRCIPAVGQVSDYTDHVGKIVSSTGEYDNSDEGLNKTNPSINEALPKVKLSNESNDKRVFGIISDKEDTNDNSRTFSQGSFHTVTPKSDNRLIINSLGEGGIWVSNYNGNLVNGDYITTSPIDGVGQKQDDDLLHNYTVAKITQDCNFDNETDLVDCQAPDGTYKMKFVGCTYHCG